MAQHPTDPVPDAPEDLTGDSNAYEIPEELGATVLDEGGGGDTPAPSPRTGALKIAIAVAALLAVGAGLLAYRAHHRRRVLGEGLARADVLLRLDTSAGYREAASLLEPLAQIDPTEAASVRAFALAMLFADYRVADVEPEAEGLLVAPGRADAVPAYANLAAAALALGRREAGSATTAVARAGEGAWARALQARVALLAGNAAAALDPAAAATAEGAFPPGLALHGDVLRRLRKDARTARAAYEAALAASPLQPRAVYGLAKLALSGQAPTDRAIAALERLLADRDGTPAVERGRAALHLAALRIRAGDRAAAAAALDAAGIDPPARAWASRAAQVAADARGPYRAVAGAPAALQSASDEDPGELSPEPPPPPPPPKAAAKAPSKKKGTAKAPARKTATSKAAAKKPTTTKRTTTSTTRKPSSRTTKTAR
ncbi:MAG TPA: hypothetical protein VFL83_00230 [Anaeromyxobacter sp.]|nr:hypothetical protein [Anaeromyxobacter sp.]